MFQLAQPDLLPEPKVRKSHIQAQQRRRRSEDLRRGGAKLPYLYRQKTAKNDCNSFYT